MLVIADLQEDHLNEHNRLREKHGSPPLTLDDELTKGCEEYAKVFRWLITMLPFYTFNTLEQVLANNEKLEHSSSAGQNYGENLCMRSQTLCNVFKTGTTKSRTTTLKSHSLQCQRVISPPSFGRMRKMGFGQAKDKKGYYWVVARYYPPVNVNGQFEENVLPPIKG